MGLRETLDEIRARSSAVLDGPEVAGVGRFYSAATEDVATLLGIVDSLVASGTDELHQAEVDALTAQIDVLTTDLTNLGREHAELGQNYQRLLDHLDNMPPRPPIGANGEGGGGRPPGDAPVGG